MMRRLGEARSTEALEHDENRGRGLRSDLLVNRWTMLSARGPGKIVTFGRIERKCKREGAGGRPPFLVVSGCF